MDVAVRSNRDGVGALRAFGVVLRNRQEYGRDSDDGVRGSTTAWQQRDRKRGAPVRATPRQGFVDTHPNPTNTAKKQHHLHARVHQPTSKRPTTHVVPIVDAMPAPGNEGGLNRCDYNSSPAGKAAPRDGRGPPTLSPETNNKRTPNHYHHLPHLGRQQRDQTRITLSRP